MKNLSVIRNIYLQFSIFAPVSCLLLIGLPCNASDDNPKCKQSIAKTSHCYIVDGKILPTADVGIILATTGNHVLVIAAARPNEPAMPDDLERVFANSPLRASVSGHFEVCPIPDQKTQFPPHYLKFVCINSAAGTVIIHYNGGH